MSDYGTILRPTLESANAATMLGLRTHDALCDVIIKAFEVLPKLRKAESTFINFAKQQYDLSVKGWAVDDLCLLVVKIAFFNASQNADLRRRIGQLATALRYLELHRDKFPAEHVKRFIENIGGVSGLVKAFRAEAKSISDPHREEKKVRTIQTYVAGLPQIGTTVHVGDGQVTTINTPKDNQTLEALAQQPGRVLLVAHVTEDFSVVDLRVIERDQDEIDRLLTRKAAQFTKTGSNDNQLILEAI